MSFGNNLRKPQIVFKDRPRSPPLSVGEIHSPVAETSCIFLFLSGLSPPNPSFSLKKTANSGGSSLRWIKVGGAPPLQSPCFPDGRKSKPHTTKTSWFANRRQRFYPGHFFCAEYSQRSPPCSPPFSSLPRNRTLSSALLEKRKCALPSARGASTTTPFIKCEYKGMEM